MFRIKDLKLKHQMILLIMIVILMVFLMQVLYNMQYYFLAVGKADKFTSSSLALIEKNIELKVANISSASSELAYNKNVQDFLKTEEQSEMLNLYNFIADYVNFMVNSDSDILDVVLVNTNGRVNRFSGKMTDEVYSELELYNFLDKRFNKRIYTSMLNSHIDRENCYALIVPVYSKFQITYGGDNEKLGVCIIICRVSGLGKLIDNSGVTKNSTFILLDRDNRVMVSNQKSLKGSTINLPKNLQPDGSEGKQNVNLDGRKSRVKYNVINATGWTVLGNIPLNELLVEFKFVRNFGIILGIVISLLLLATGQIFMRNITGPIEKIVTMMKKVGKINVKFRLELPYRNEVGMIAGDINRMLDEIEMMTRRILETQANLYEMELSKKQTELNALQSQINPHFLYNTLECMKCIGLVYNSGEIVRISTSMADIFRYSIKGNEYSLISEELECVKNYMDIMCIRYANKFSFDMNIDAEILACRTLKMILQPIVENAMYHGLENKVGPGLLRIIGKKKNDRIVFEISDNGRGIKPNELLKISQSLDNNQATSESDNKKSIGLININSRIRLYFGKDFGLSISSRENEGTVVSVEIPMSDKT